MSRKIRILSLDGGGIRGIIPGTILTDIERRIQDNTGDYDRKLADCFDLIAGTSTGGILACLYLLPDEETPWRPKYSADQVLDVYRQYGGKIFTASKWRKFMSRFRTLFDERYHADALEETLQDYFGDATLLDLLKPCLIPAYDIREREAKFFNSADGTREGRNFDVKDVARATSAAPTYFEASMIRSKDEVPHALIDGGVFANNPAMFAYSEAMNLDFADLLDDEHAPTRPTAKDMMIVSIGTGKETQAYRWDKAKNWGMIGWLRPVLDIMMSAAAEIVDFQLRRLFAIDRNYIRMDPELHNASKSMDDASQQNIKDLEIAGKRFIEHHDEKLEVLVKDLIAAGQ